MEKRSSAGVTLIGWGLIICNGLFFILPIFDLRRSVYNLFNIYSPPLQLVWFISSLILVGFIIGGWQLLKLQELGRSLIVFLSIIDMPHLIVGKAIYDNNGLRPMYIRNFFLIPLGIAIDLIMIYFLNHPKVKAQFK